MFRYNAWHIKQMNELQYWNALNKRTNIITNTEAIYNAVKFNGELLVDGGAAKPGNIRRLHDVDSDDETRY